MRIGFDIGGTKVAAIALDSSGQALAANRLPLPKTYEDLVALCCQCTQSFEQETGQTAETIGLGVAAPLNTDGRTARTRRIAVLDGTPLVADLENLLQRPVNMANDANCFALSEAMDGAAKGHRIVFGAILGTGIGGGIVIDNKIWNGPQSLAGEWGNLQMPWPQEHDQPYNKCPWGHDGCIETLLAGAALERLFTGVSGIETDGGTICLLAEQEEPEALATVNLYADRLARALTSIIFMLDPDVIVLGGSVSRLPGLVGRVTDMWGNYNLSRGAPFTTQLVLAQHGPDSGVRGAAWL